MPLGTSERAERGGAPRTRMTAKKRVRPGAAAARTASAEAPSFRTLYEELLGGVYRFLSGQVGQWEAAEDLIAQVFVTALRALDRTRARARIQSWRYRVARTMLANYWRSLYRLRATLLESLLEQGWEEPAAAQGARPSSRAEERVRRIQDEFPSHYREVLISRFVRHCSIKETAEQLRLSEG